MKIAVASDRPDMNGLVSETFAGALWLLIVNMDDGHICEVIKKQAEDIENKEFADIIIKWDCESVICGDIEKIPFEILAGRGVTRSNGSGFSVADALAREDKLELITDYIGGSGCGSHTGDSCDGEHIF